MIKEKNTTQKKLYHDVGAGLLQDESTTIPSKGTITVKFFIFFSPYENSLRLMLKIKCI
ncbi:uncharacterized protein METZ01_LOCUS297688 [marine metagenome]|uniref:Uncharacterized protein n=1 Tax=marine metagenome TaxID=408172 RepID=A0A382M727_9ZZZZ